MNSRDRFNAILNFENGVENLKYEFGYWAGLLRKWKKQNFININNPSEILNDSDLIRISLPIDSKKEKNLDKFFLNYFNLDPYPSKFPFDFSPLLPEKIVEENHEFKIIKDSYGATQKIIKEGTSVPMVLIYPIKNTEDFNSYKELYNRDFKKRLPENWDDLAVQLGSRDFPIRLGGNPFGFCGMPRHLMGDINYMLSLYDNPELIKDINDFYLDFAMSYWSEILSKVEIDWVMIWEDMAFKTGSFISKESFKEFLTPYYIKFIDFLKQYGVKNIIVDCDGLVEELIPLWLEIGVTGIFPMEAVNDLIKIRKNFPKLQMLGGVDKRILIRDYQRDINKELEKISLIIKTGGFIPHIDHAIPMDADWHLFKEYREKLNDIIA